MAIPKRRGRVAWPLLALAAVLLFAVLAAWQLGAYQVVDVAAPAQAVAVAGAPGEASAESLAQGVILTVLGIAFSSAPLWLPPVLSWKGKLSVGRWAILAALFFFLAGVLYLMCEEAIRRSQFGNREDARIYALPMLMCGMGVVGCLVAAVVYPKTPP